MKRLVLLSLVVASVLMLVASNYGYSLSPYKKTTFVSYYNYNIDAEWSKKSFFSAKKIFSQFGKGKKNLSALKNISNFCSYNKLILKGKAGDIVVIRHKLDDFIQDVTRRVDTPFIGVLVCDATFPTEFEHSEEIIEALNDGRLIHLFSTNADLSKCPSNVTQIPLGMSYSKLMTLRSHMGQRFPVSPRGHDKNLHAILKDLKPTNERSIRPLCDFALCNSSKDRKKVFGEDRAEIAAMLKRANVCDILEERMSHYELLKAKGERAFDISPPGGGIDCFRTWEALILGCIPIVKTSFLDSLYEGLPVVIVNDWSEITQANLKKWLAKYGDTFNDAKVREKLTHEYWMRKIKIVQSDFREKAISKNN